MKKNKSYLAVILILIFCLASCGQNNQAENKKQSSKTQQAITADKEQKVLPIPEPVAESVVLPIIPSEIILISNYFKNDADAQDLANNRTIVTMPETYVFSERELPWRIMNAYRMLGFEAYGIPFDQRISAQAMIELDNKLAGMEKTIAEKAAKLPFYKDISGPDFLDHIPQKFVAYLFASIFDLLNAGDTKYVLNTEDCFFANLCPCMKGSFVDYGGILCSGQTGDPLVELIFQPSDLFGFFNIRRKIGDNEYPKSAYSSTYMYIATASHEMLHTINKNSRGINNFYNRQVNCAGTFMDFSLENSPFTDDGIPGNQDLKDYVSEYGSGMLCWMKYYSQHENASESVTAYMLLPEYFREIMKNSERLRAEYEYIKTRFFSGVEFSNPTLKNFKNFKKPTQISEFYLINDKIPTFVISDIIAYKM
jgi:hypothetical protein